MALRTFVKISQVNNLSDARYCAGMGVGMLGFNLEPGTVHYVDPEKFRAISEWVAGVNFAAEFVEASPETIKRLLPEYPVNFLQTDKAEYLQDLQQFELPLILRIPVNASSTVTSIEPLMDQHQEQVAFFLLEAEGETQLPDSLVVSLLSLSKQYPIVSALEVEAETVTQLLDQYPLEGIALKGGEEIRAGFKDFDELADILEALEVDEAY